MNKTKIEWVKNPDGSPGYTWNPVTGCNQGCEYCYARVISNRFDKAGGFKPTFHKHRAWILTKKRKPSTIFVCSMGDLFGDWVPRDWIEDVLRKSVVFNKHKYLFLTKNPLRYLEFGFPENCWIGATTDTADRAGEASNALYLKETARGRRFISAEPLLEDISKSVCFEAVDWIIIGGLNRNGKTVPADKGGTRYEWARNLIIQSLIHDVPVFVKDGLCEVYPQLKKWRELPYLEIK